MSWHWQLGILAVGIVIALVIEWGKRANAAADGADDTDDAATPARPAQPAQPAVGARLAARGGGAPHPAARIINMPDRVMRLIDLRWLPADDLTVLRLGVAQQQLALDRIAPIQIWVVDLAIARGWAALDFTARFLGLKRLRDPRNPSGQNFIHTVGGRLSDAEIAAIKEVGLDVVLGMESIGATSKSLEDYLSPVTPWQSSPDDRPVADVVTITTGVLDGELIHVIGTSAFIDLRRATPEAIENGVAITRIEAGLLGLPTPIKRITWVTAPWVLELVDADRTARIEKLASSLSASIDQRLAVYSAGGEPTPEHPLMQRFRPAADLELLQMLHDAYYTRAWKQPHL